MKTFRSVGYALTLFTTSAIYFASQAATGAQYQWDFSGNLSPSIGSGILSYADGLPGPTSSVTNFGTTNGTTVPHIGGQPATYMNFPQFTTLTQGYNAEFTNTVPNGGGLYVNQYTMVFDVMSPGSIDWTSFFNTNPSNPSGNDGDFYIASDGSLGISDLGYSAANVIAPNTWYRIAFTADLGAGLATYYLNGTQVFQRTGASLADGRFALESNLDPGHDLRLFNEGDTSGNYTHELYLNSFYFADRTLSASEIGALGGPSAAGIAAVPEPASFVLLIAAICGGAAVLRRR